MHIIQCDKCKKTIPTADYLESGEIVTKRVCTLTFHFERMRDAENPNQYAFSNPICHDWTLDICPDCQEKIIKEIIGATPWPEGR